MALTSHVNGRARRTGLSPAVRVTALVLALTMYPAHGVAHGVAHGGSSDGLLARESTPLTSTTVDLPESPRASDAGAVRDGRVPAPFVSDTPPARTAGLTGQDSVARIVARASPSRATYSIMSTDGRTALLLLDSTLVLQLTAQGLDEIARGDTEDAGRGFLAGLLDSILRGGLKLLLNRGIEYSLADLEEARYEGGRLVFWSVRGTEVFETVNLNGAPVMAGFSEADARDFAERVNQARVRLRNGG